MSIADYITDDDLELVKASAKEDVPPATKFRWLIKILDNIEERSQHETEMHDLE